MNAKVLSDAERAALTLAPIPLAEVRAIHQAKLDALRADPQLGALWAALLAATPGQEQAALEALYITAPPAARPLLRTLRATTRILLTGRPLPVLAGPPSLSFPQPNTPPNHHE